ncbi:MAG: hypothetical protein OXC53_01590, partial [Rhodobacteraceae bacterium]|nr:hypothetical protein [Paracoccaceae bacterium]
MIENRKEHRAGLMDWALSLTMMMTVGLSDPGLAQTRNDPIHQVIGEMTTILERQAGRTLPAAAALMLSGHVDVVIRPDSNQVWLVGTDDAIVDVGELRVRERRNNADLMVSWETHGHRVVPPDVLLSLLREGTFGDTHPAYLCQLQVAAGGMLRTAVGAIPAGALIGNGAVTHDGQLLALFAGSGDQLRFMDSDGNDMRL